MVCSYLKSNYGLIIFDEPVFRYNGMTLLRYCEVFEGDFMGNNGLFGLYGGDGLGGIKN